MAETEETKNKNKLHSDGCGCLDCTMDADEFNAAIREVADCDVSESRCDEAERSGAWDDFSVIAEDDL